MAYSLHYICGYTNIHGNRGRVAIYEDDYGGGTENLTVRHDSVKTQYNWKGWEEPIIGLSASFAIVNDKDDFFDLLPLMTAEERKYWIVIEELDHIPTRTLFEGFLDCKDMEQKYLQRQDLHFNASGYLSKLQYVYSPTVETLENDTFINIILNCLEQTGNHPNGFQVYVNCSLYPIGVSLSSSQSLFNKCGVYKEVFWKNNIDRDSALDIMKKILKAFDCYLFWWNENYYIQRYADAWDVSPIYVRYSSGSEYWPSDSGSALAGTKTIYDFVDLDKLDTSQTIGIIPGQKQIEVDVEQQKLFNFVINNFEDATHADKQDDPPYPGLRQWKMWSDWESSGAAHGYDWPIALRGEPFNNITKAINRLDYEESTVGNRSYIRGLTTRFRATITEESVMTLKFKFGVPSTPFIWGGNPEDYEFNFLFYLQNPPGNYFIVYDEVSTNLWERLLSPLSFDDLNWLNVSGAEMDPDLLTVEVNQTINLKDIYDSGVWDGDQEFVLGICQERVAGGSPTFHVEFREDVYYGDVEITFNSPLDDNYISGEVNTNFLNKLTIVQPIIDAGDLGIKNAVLYNDTGSDESSLNLRSQTWDDSHSSSAEGLDLAEMKIKDKFRLYNVSRQKIQSTILADETIYRPFALFEDGNQQDSTGTGPPEFVLVGYSYRPQSDQMDVILSEYDNEEDINIV